MTEETTQVHTTSQEAESTQPDVTDELDQSTSTTEGDTNADDQAGNTEEGKDPNGWALKRIGALTAKTHQTERELQAAKGEAERYRLLVEQMQRGEETAPVNVPGEPQDIDALVNKRAAELSQQQAMQERGQSVAKVGAESFPDFDGAVKTLDALGITNEQVQSLLGMDDAHKVIYSLGKNPDEAVRILSLSPLQQGRELERLAAKPLPVAPPKAVSKAPAPIAPIDGTAAGEVDPSKLSMADWAKWREKTAKTRF
ncbi:hypothetical protein [Pseudomonas sp. MONT-RG-20F-20-E-7-02]|uniref:hypothetical protein n=1 Tax=Pseudomonas sp. MONT-RG-20F-20-E-7-02 TaxID=2914979 RepID=UPI001F59FCFB|nr:hypothetical protein [Pseudomonas sp. MONT-RG-20F-20-E-7-02]